VLPPRSRSRGHSAGFDPTAWHRLQLVVTATSTAATIDGDLLFNLSSRDGAPGYVAIGSSYNGCEFDNFTYHQLPSPPIPPPAAGAAVAFEPCAPASEPLSAHQRWFESSASDGDMTGSSGRLVTLHPSSDHELCLDFSDISQLRTQACAAGTSTLSASKQHWNLSSAVELDPQVLFVRAVGAGCPFGSGGRPVGGCCMEMSGNDRAAGTAADLYACEANGGGDVPCANEVFTRPRLIDGVSQIVVQSTGFCLTVMRSSHN
jgi:hypothetical protein